MTTALMIISGIVASLLVSGLLIVYLIAEGIEQSAGGGG